MSAAASSQAGTNPNPSAVTKYTLVTRKAQLTYEPSTIGSQPTLFCNAIERSDIRDKVETEETPSPLRALEGTSVQGGACNDRPGLYLQLHQPPSNRWPKDKHNVTLNGKGMSALSAVAIPRSNRTISDGPAIYKMHLLCSNNDGQGSYDVQQTDMALSQVEPTRPLEVKAVYPGSRPFAEPRSLEGTIVPTVGVSASKNGDILTVFGTSGHGSILLEASRYSGVRNLPITGTVTQYTKNTESASAATTATSSSDAASAYEGRSSEETLRPTISMDDDGNKNTKDSTSDRITAS